MNGVFQLIHGENGTRSEPMCCTERQFIEVINSMPEERTAELERAYVLVLMHKQEHEVDWQYSLFPLMLVPEFVSLYGSAV